VEKYIKAAIVLPWLVFLILSLVARHLEHLHTASLWVHAALQWIKRGAWVALCVMGAVSVAPLIALGAVRISERWFAPRQTDQR
jgi:hypothetical protein